MAAAALQQVVNGEVVAIDEADIGAARLVSAVQYSTVYVHSTGVQNRLFLTW